MIPSVLDMIVIQRNDSGGKPQRKQSGKNNLLFGGWLYLEEGTFAYEFCLTEQCLLEGQKVKRTSKVQLTKDFL